MTAALFNTTLWASLVTLSYALVGAYVLLSGGGVLLRRQILVVVFGGVVWGLLFARSGQARVIPHFVLLAWAAQILLLYSWYQLLHRLLRGPYERSMPGLVRWLLRLFWIMVLSALAVVAWFASSGPALWHDTVCSVTVAAVALLCLALAAQFVSDAPVENRTATRALAFAAALVSGSQAVVGIVAAAGAGVPRWLSGLAALCLAAAALLMLFALRQRPQWSLDTFVSPEARSYAPRLLATGSILLVALFLLPVFRSMEPLMARQSALLMVLGMGTPLVILLFSERLNARLKVFVSKHFVPFRYDYREEWLRLIDTLVSKGSELPLPERVIKALAEIVGSPAGILWTRVDENRQLTALAGWNVPGLPESRIAIDDPLVLFMVERQWIIDTAELSRRPELYSGLKRPLWLDAFPDGLLIVPLISNATLSGLIMLHQPGSSFRLSFEEIDLLRTAGRQVAAFLAQYEADQKLAEGRQFEAFNRLTAFVMHDLKNLIAQQSLMLRNAAKHKGNPAFIEDAMATIDNSVVRMSKLLQQLQSGEATGVRQRVRAAAAVADAVERCQGREPVPQFADAGLDLQVWIDRERFTAVLVHLIRNAQEATARDGSVSVAVAAAGTGVEITIEDDGCGMDPEFIRTRLFRPFDTTKGSKGMGIGVYQARTLVMDAGGSLRVDSEPDGGTRFTVWLPLHEPGTVTPAA
ncbi:MAG: PEP-CTERM system histidine kinase PrsK [Gammaproteobacteria bacterium]